MFQEPLKVNEKCGNLQLLSAFLFVNCCIFNKCIHMDMSLFIFFLLQPAHVILLQLLNVHMFFNYWNWCQFYAPIKTRTFFVCSSLYLFRTQYFNIFKQWSINNWLLVYSFASHLKDAQNTSLQNTKDYGTCPDFNYPS